MVTDNFLLRERSDVGADGASRTRHVSGERRLGAREAPQRHTGENPQRSGRTHRGEPAALRQDTPGRTHSFRQDTTGKDIIGLSKMRGPGWLRAALLLALLTVLGTRAVDHLSGAKIKTVDGNVVFMAARRGGDIKFKDTHTAIFGNLTIQEVMDRSKDQVKKLDEMLAEANRMKMEVSSQT
ncbi:uncharacterized protein [Branchiostoma lanceolatum]|uniref:uncharacterized protein n=1 Tax=Branchiostoma lanceolatum TaxID=7740 RepID=UPI003454BF07